MPQYWDDLHILRVIDRLQREEPVRLSTART
jgi:hypothetical protein